MKPVPSTLFGGDTVTRTLYTLTLLFLVAGMAQRLDAAVLQIDSLTINPSPAGDLKVDATIETLTIDGTTHDKLESITSVSLPGNRERMWGQNATDPGSDDAAILGLNYGTGVLNVGAGTTFQFGRTLGSNEILFVIRDGAPNTTITFVPVSGTSTIGNYTLSIAQGQFNTFSKRVDLKREGGANLNDRERAGTSFTLADFTGTTGDLSTATGFRVTTNGSGWDVAAVGVVVPEPASAVMIGLSGLLFLRRRRA